MANEMRDRLKENISIIKRHNETGLPVKHITKGQKYEVEVIAEIVEDVSLIIEKMEKERLIEIPCNIGDTVYVISDCSRIMMLYDNDYFTGTGAITCPYEDACKFTECNDENTQVIETCVSHMLCDDEGWTFGCENINCCYSFNDIGKTVFLTKAEAEQKLKEMRGGNDS